MNVNQPDGSATTSVPDAGDVRYRRLFEAARDGIVILDATTGMVVDVNPFLIELLGYSREAFLGKKIWELGFFKDIVANQAHFAELQQKNTSTTKTWRWKPAAGGGSRWSSSATSTW